MLESGSAGEREWRHRKMCNLYGQICVICTETSSLLGKGVDSETGDWPPPSNQHTHPMHTATTTQPS